MSRLGYVLALNAESQGRSDAEAPIHGAIASCSESQRGSRLEQDLCKWQVVFGILCRLVSSCNCLSDFSRTPLSLAAVSESWQGPVVDGFVVLGRL